MIVIVAAIAGKSRALGFRGQLLYHIPEDMRRFRETTMGHPIIMGSKTFQSLPNGPLPGRRNIVVSRSIREIPGCEVYDSIGRAVESCSPDSTVFVIGGGEVYRQTLPYASTLLLTEIDAEPVEADTYFPEFIDEFREVDRERRDGYSFVRYVRI